MILHGKKASFYKGGHPVLIMMGRNEIRQFDLVTSNYRQIIDGLHSASSFDYLLDEKIFIWADDSNRTIYRSGKTET